MIHRALERGDWMMWIYVAVFFLCSMLTVLYCYRLYVKVFFGQHVNPYADLTPVPPVMQWPVSVLAILSLGIFFWQFKGQDWHALYPRENTIEGISIAWTLLSFGLAWFLFTNRKSQITNQQFSLDSFYDKVIIQPSLRTSNAFASFDKNGIDSVLHGFVYSQVIFAKVARYFDRYVVDGTVWLVTWTAKATGNVLRSVNGGRIQSYLAWSAIALIIFIFWILK